MLGSASDTGFTVGTRGCCEANFRSNAPNRLPASAVTSNALSMDFIRVTLRAAALVHRREEPSRSMRVLRQRKPVAGATASDWAPRAGYGWPISLRGSFLPQAIVELFVDVDGTLLEFSAIQQPVFVPAVLRNARQLAAKREDGALALITGRTIGEFDRLFARWLFWPPDSAATSVVDERMLFGAGFHWSGDYSGRESQGCSIKFHSIQYVERKPYALESLSNRLFEFCRAWLDADKRVFDCDILW